MDKNLLFIIFGALMLIVAATTPIVLLIMLRRQRESIRELLDLKVALIEAFQRLSKPMSDALGENRRNNRLMAELLALKQAEMTGDFEVVEEPIAPPPSSTPSKSKNRISGKNGASKLTPPPQNFPEL